MSCKSALRGAEGYRSYWYSQVLTIANVQLKLNEIEEIISGNFTDTPPISA